MTATKGPEPLVQPEDASTDGAAATEGGWTFWVGLALGWGVIAYGLWGAYSQEGATNPTELWKWIAGGLVAHDAVVAPLVTVLAIAAAKFLPAKIRGPVCGALVLSGLVLLFSYPVVRGFGRHELNPSTLPLDYTRNVVVILVGIWVTAAAIILIRTRRSVR